MGQPITGNNELCKKIADVLGIKHCCKLEIKMECGAIVSAKAEFYPEEDGLIELPKILKEYTLLEKEV